MRLLLFGPSGAGKGTQSQWLAGYLGVPHLSTGDMLRAASQSESPLGVELRKHLAAGHLVPDEIVLDIVRRRLKQPDCEAGCLLDGFPRTLLQARALDELLCANQTPLECVLELAVDDERLVERLAGRNRADDQPEIVRERLAIYRDQTAPLLDYYRQRGILHTINGNEPPDQVAARIKSIVDQTRHHVS